MRLADVRGLLEEGRGLGFAVRGSCVVTPEAAEAAGASPATGAEAAKLLPASTRAIAVTRVRRMWILGE